MEPFLISEKHLRQLSATRQGRISIGGFNYQAGYAVARLASMVVGQSILDLPDVPKTIRYDWGEDLDERCRDGTVIFTQCKRIESIGQPTSLAQVLLSFVPKWLFVPADARDKVRFRLVATDMRFRSGAHLSELGAQAKAETCRPFLITLGSSPGSKTDRAIWQSEADSLGHQKLFDQLWDRTDVIIVSGTPIDEDPAAPLLRAERAALSLLLAHDKIVPKKQTVALDRLRRVIHDNLIEFDPANTSDVQFPIQSPRYRDASDVSLALAACRDDSPTGLPFEIVDRTFLSIQRQAPRRQFVARQPDWADVVHGADNTVKFIERDVTNSLREAVVHWLVEPIERGTSRRLHMLFVTGAPGSGKTTLARRVAAILVDEGRIVVADAGLDIRDPVDSPETYIRQIQSIAALGRPIIFLVDDPLYAKSPWVELLHRLARPGLGVAILAPSPQLLYDRHATAIAFGSKHTIQIGRPTERERTEMATLYSRDSKALQTADEFLVIAMEAAAGVPFDEIISRLWRTLNDGEPLIDDERQAFGGLRWRIRAFLIVSFFHRAYSTCPEALMRAALELSGGELPAAGIANALAQLHDEHGWKLFQLSDIKNPYRAYLGVQIATAHQRIASRAWDLRPLRWIDVGDWIIQASLHAPQTLRRSGGLAARLASSEDDLDKGLASRLVDAVIEHNRHAATPTRYLCDLATTLQINGQFQVVTRLAPLCERAAVPSGDGWMAALQLHFLSGESIHEQVFPASLELSQIINAADFSLAPTLAQTFFLRLPSYLRPVITSRLLDAFDGRLSWRLEGYLTAWLIANATTEAIITRADAIFEWLRAHPADVRVRVAYFSRLSKQRLDDGHLLRLIDDTSTWLKQNSGDSHMRPMYLATLSKRNIDEARLERAVADTEEWLEDHPEDTMIRITYLALLTRQPLVHRYLPKALATTEQWLKDHPADARVRSAYLTRLAQLPMRDDALKQAAVDAAVWLADHHDDCEVRVANLILLSRQSSLREAYLPNALAQAGMWLQVHPENKNVLSLFESITRNVQLEKDGHATPKWQSTDVGLRIEDAGYRIPDSKWSDWDERHRRLSDEGRSE
jgi:hypothetical protein